MLLAEPTVRYRLSRSELVRKRALRRILRCDINTRKLFGESPPSRERRREPRQSLQVPINLRPAQMRGLSVFPDQQAPPFLAVTRNISVGGVGFVHDERAPSPLFLAEFDVGEREPLVLLVELRWSGEQSAHSYRSGGRILGIVRRV